jgi:hypothetical protein
MKRVLIVSVSLLGAFFITQFAIWAVRVMLIPHEVKDHISIAKMKYPVGKAEDALIAYLLDTSNSPRDRSDIAIWTLGLIGSEKALLILKDRYKNDPKGEICKGKHNLVLCQRKIHYAIKGIEHKDSWFSLQGLNK